MIKSTWAVREIIPLKNCAQGTIGVGVKGFGGGPFKDRIEGQIHIETTRDRFYNKSNFALWNSTVRVL